MVTLWRCVQPSRNVAQLGRCKRQPRRHLTPITQLQDVLARNSVHAFAMYVFGTPYTYVQREVYPKQRYRAFVLPKKTGGVRLIHAPRLKLKTMQHQLATYLHRVGSTPKPSAHGFRAGRSIVTNAAAHSHPRTQFLLNIDLQDFFPSISFYRVRGLLEAPPFNFSRTVASLAAHICTFRNGLPQGAPTSPIISNLIARSLDRDLMSLARRHRCKYTRYVDDISFSFSVRTSAALPESLCSFDGGILVVGPELRSIVASNGFTLNEAKSRMSTSDRRMEVTGLTINRFPNVRRKFIDEIRGALHACEKHGYQRANEFWRKSFLASSGIERARFYRNLRTGRFPELIHFLRGKILFVKMVRGEEDFIYNRLAERFNAVAHEHLAPLLTVYPVVKTEAELRRACFVIIWEADHVETDTGKTTHVSGQGTGFLYTSENLITCSHVFFDNVGVGEDIRRVHINSPQLENVRCQAIDHANVPLDVTLMHYDDHRDLAVLKFDKGPAAFKHIAPAHSAATRGDRGWLNGYPDYNPGKPINVVPSQVNNIYPRQGLGRVELTTTIRAGYSGGPYVNESYGLIGVALRGATQAHGTDECLSNTELDSWLATL